MIPLTIVMTDAPLEARWLTEILATAGYVVVVVSALLGGRWLTRSYTSELRGGGQTLSVVEAYSVGGGGVLCRWRRTLSVAVAVEEAKRGSWCKL